jgi:L-ribulose-5-phosphate 4-epimerase
MPTTGPYGADEGFREEDRAVTGDFTQLRELALAANLALPRYGLVTLTWGNASAIDHDRGVVAIKPSGVAYDALSLADIVVVELEDGRVIEGDRRPSTDTPTHLALYREFEALGGIVHTHSTWATVWAQAQRQIPVYGTTHADLCATPIPVTRQLTEAEIDDGYELHTGTVLIEALAGTTPEEVPCALVRGHAPFAWGATAAKAVENAVTLEEVARMAFLTATLAPSAPPLDDAVRRKHHERKHGPRAYYGQPA